MRNNTIQNGLIFRITHMHTHSEKCTAGQGADPPCPSDTWTETFITAGPRVELPARRPEAPGETAWRAGSSARSHSLPPEMTVLAAGWWERYAGGQCEGLSLLLGDVP